MGTLGKAKSALEKKKEETKAAKEAHVGQDESGRAPIEAIETHTQTQMHAGTRGSRSCSTV